MGPIVIRRGLDPRDADAAAALYWQAFGPKLGRLLGPEPRARAYLIRAMRPDHVFTAHAPQGALVGIAGFRTTVGAFAIGRPLDLVAIYGWPGAVWRVGALRLVRQDIAPDRFRIDGLAVGQDQRGQGIGSQLLVAVMEEAARQGYDRINLDVVTGNTRARALYERHGFAALGESRPGPLGPLLGFHRATRMECRLG
ncbi:MAG: GNAT family N-acetyltransferase [Paracoccaceae bacterium]|nr:GNAT family N-acetyltransferase [Paracoccaceae bacterium]